MNKKLLLLLIALITVSLLVFSACNAPDNDDGGNQTQTNGGIGTGGGTTQGGNSGAQQGGTGTSGGVFDCSAALHNYTVENKCSICSAELKYSKGLRFRGDAGDNYLVYSIGSCTDTEIVIPYGLNGKLITGIYQLAFKDCTEITSVSIPDSVEAIGSMAFYGCTKLASVTIGNSVTDIGHWAFRDTEYYNDEANWEDGVLYVGDYLIEAKEKISGSYTIKDGTLCVASNAFEHSLIMSVSMPNSVKSINKSAFYKCTRLTSVTIPDSVTNIAESAFFGCGLSSLTIPNSVTSIGGGAFQNCTGLRTVTLPNSVTTISNFLFSGCSGLTSITIPNSVTSIGDNAFRDCTGLTSVTIGNRVKNIEPKVFYNCTGLTSINYRGTEAQWKSITKGDKWDEYYRGDYYPLNYTLTYNYTGE